MNGWRACHRNEKWKKYISGDEISEVFPYLGNAYLLPRRHLTAPYTTEIPCLVIIIVWRLCAFYWVYWEMTWQIWDQSESIARALQSVFYETICDFPYFSALPRNRCTGSATKNSSEPRPCLTALYSTTKKNGQNFLGVFLFMWATAYKFEMSRNWVR